MALVILQPNETNGPYGGFSPDNIIGATGDETVYIAGDGVVLLDPSFSAGGDTIYIDGLAGDYQVKVSGSNLVLTNDDGAEITIPAGPNGVDIHFNDSTRELIIQGGGLFLGDQNIPGGGTVVDVDPGNQAPAFSDDAVTIHVDKGVAFNDSLIGAAVDPDGDDLTYSLLTQASNGTVVVNADGTYSYTPNTGFQGNDSYVVRVTDEFGATDTLTVNVVVADPGSNGEGRMVGLTVGSDFVVPGSTGDDASDGDDTFRARVAQNNDGAQANQLGSGDYIDGGDGLDTLSAWIQGATPLGGSVGSTSIAPETTDVENIEFRAVRVSGSISDVDPEDLASLFFGEMGPHIGVQVDASDMFGVDDIGSYQSDESLTITDMTTLADDGETIRATGDITVHMDHTGNNTSVGAESDLTVLFDRDYLICEDMLPTGGQLFLEVMDLDAAILLQNGVTTYPAGRSNAGLPIEGPLDDSPYGVINFTLGGEERSLIIGTDYDTYPELLAAVQAAIASQPELNGSIPGGANIVASLGPIFTANDTDSDPGGSAQGTTIVLTNTGNDAQFSDVTLDATVEVPGEKDFHLQPYTEAPEGMECLIEVDVVLDKVGRGGDGGELTIGGMVPDLDNVWDRESESGLPELPRGVEQFNVTVEGNDSEDSSLAAIRSTDNTLQAIIIGDEGTSEADLVIGNRNTAYDGFDPLFASFEDILGPGFSDIIEFSLYQFLNGGGLIDDIISEFVDLTDPITIDLSTVKNNAVKDVLTFDASAFDNDTEVHAFFSDEVVDKYLNLTDTDPSDGDAPDATVDNVDGDAVWTFGDGENILNVNISQTNMAVEGSATREDFSFTTFTNGGDDTVQIQLGNGVGTCFDESTESGAAIEAWYHNHVLNQNLHIDTGSGDDMVEVWGSSAADINLGSGDDVAFVDNSGLSQVGYNEGRATWVFNTQGADNINNLVSETSTSISNVANLQLRVSFQGVESVWVEVGDSFGSINGETITDLDIIQAIKDAINSDISGHGSLELSDLLAAEDGPSRTLAIRSLIDGLHDAGDLVVELRTDPTPFTPAQVAGSAITFDAATGLGELGFTTAGAQIIGERFDSTFANQSGFGTLSGFDSENVNNNNVEGGLGNDLIVLSSQEDSIETIDINGVFGDDVILNFTAGVAEVDTEEQTITFGGEDAAEGSVTVTLNGVDYTVDVGGTGEPLTPEEIAAAIADEINDGDSFTAVVDGAEVTVTAVEPGVDYDPATVTVVADGPETQDIAFSGSAAGVTSVSMTFGDVTNTYVTDGTPTLAEIANGLATLFTADGFTVVNTDGTDGLFTITNTEGGDIPLASFSISGSNVALDADATTTTPGAEPTTTFDVVTVEDGAIINSGGFDIFDVTTVLGGAVLNVINNQPTLFSGSGDGLERATISDLVDNNHWVGIIDTVEANDVPTASTGQSELQLIQQIATLEDTTAGPGTASQSIVITVNDDNVGTFYLINDGASAGDVQVSRLGSVELGQYDVIGKENIGDWDAMSLSNFTPLSADQLASSYVAVCDDPFLIPSIPVIV